MEGRWAGLSAEQAPGGRRGEKAVGLVGPGSLGEGSCRCVVPAVRWRGLARGGMACSGLGAGFVARSQPGRFAWGSRVEERTFGSAVSQGRLMLGRWAGRGSRTCSGRGCSRVATGSSRATRRLQQQRVHHLGGAGEALGSSGNNNCVPCLGQ